MTSEITYPRWLHHRTLDPIVARNEAEGNAMLASGWALLPSAFYDCEPEEGKPTEPPTAAATLKRRGRQPRKV